MKKRIIISLFVAMIIIALTTIVNAASKSVTLTASATEVKAGGTFSIDVTAKSEKQLEAIAGAIKYDFSKLQLTNAEAITEATGGLSEFIRRK